MHKNATMNLLFCSFLYSGWPKHLGQALPFIIWRPNKTPMIQQNIEWYSFLKQWGLQWQNTHPSQLYWLYQIYLLSLGTTSIMEQKQHSWFCSICQSSGKLTKKWTWNEGATLSMNWSSWMMLLHLFLLMYMSIFYVLGVSYCPTWFCQKSHLCSNQCRWQLKSTT